MSGTIRLHGRINVAWRRLGAVLPACDGPDCEFCAGLEQALAAQPPSEAPPGRVALIAEIQQCLRRLRDGAFDVADEHRLDQEDREVFVAGYVDACNEALVFTESLRGQA